MTREMSLQRTEFSGMKSRVVDMQDKFNQILEEGLNLKDVSRDLVQVHGNLDTLKTDLEKMLNLANNFNKMDGLIADVSSMTDELDGMMKSELFKTSDELTPMRSELSNINAKLSDLQAINGKLDTLSNDSVKLGGIEISLEHMKTEYDALKSDAAEILKEIGNYILIKIWRLSNHLSILTAASICIHQDRSATHIVRIGLHTLGPNLAGVSPDPV